MRDSIELPKQITLSSPEASATRYIRVNGEKLQTAKEPEFLSPKEIDILVFLKKGSNPELVQFLLKNQWESGLVRIVEMRDNKPVLVASYHDIQDPENVCVGLFDKKTESITETYPAHLSPQPGDYALGTTAYQPGVYWNMKEFRYVIHEVTDISREKARIRLARAFQ